MSSNSATDLLITLQKAEKLIKELRGQLATEQKVDTTMLTELLGEIATWKQKTRELEDKLQAVIKHLAPPNP